MFRYLNLKLTLLIITLVISKELFAQTLNGYQQIFGPQYVHCTWSGSAATPEANTPLATYWTNMNFTPDASSYSWTITNNSNGIVVATSTTPYMQYNFTNAPTGAYTVSLVLIDASMSAILEEQAKDAALEQAAAQQEAEEKITENAQEALNQEVEAQQQQAETLLQEQETQQELSQEEAQAAAYEQEAQQQEAAAAEAEETMLEAQEAELLLQQQEEQQQAEAAAAAQAQAQEEAQLYYGELFALRTTSSNQSYIGLSIQVFYDGTGIVNQQTDYLYGDIYEPLYPMFASQQIVAGGTSAPSYTSNIQPPISGGAHIYSGAQVGLHAPLIVFQPGFKVDKGGILEVNTNTDCAALASFMTKNNIVARKAATPPTTTPLPTGNASDQANLFKIYPNPSSGVVNVSNYSMRNKPVTINVYNSIGQEVYNSTKKSSVGIVKLDLSEQPAGIYIVQASTGCTSSSQKVVIE